MFAGPGTPEAEYTEVVELDLGDRRAERRRAQAARRIACALSTARQSFETPCPRLAKPKKKAGAAAATGRPASATRPRRRRSPERASNGSVVIAAITSCTNTSNPSVLVAAGLLAKKAVERGPAAPSRG